MRLGALPPVPLDERPAPGCVLLRCPVCAARVVAMTRDPLDGYDVAIWPATLHGFYSGYADCPARDGAAVTFPDGATVWVEAAPRVEAAQ